MKKLSFIQRNNQRHWVGDGFPVRSIFSYNDIAKDLSPFLLLDYAGPANFPPSEHRRGVGEHPHRGFETVTIVYDGEADLAVMSRDGETLSFEATENSTLLLLSGTPLNEPIVGHGPFVMNTEAEIRQAFVDYQSGRMGRIN